MTIADKTIALGRERYIDTNQWFWLSSSIGGLALALLLAAAIPTYGWIPFLVLGAPAVLGAGGSLLHRGLSERLYSISHLCFIVSIGVCAAYVGGAQSLLLPLLCPYALGFFSRLRPSIAIGYAVSGFVLAIVPVLILDWSDVVRSPWLLGSCAVGMVALTLIAAQMAAGEIRHRGDATIDQLTGLLNRRGLEDRLIELGEQALVIGLDTPMALVAIDLDNFKLVNDTYGHPRGDDVLRDVAYLMRKGLRRFELAYRMGGEEFLIVLPGHEADEAYFVAESIRRSIESARPGGVQVTISMGVAAGRAADFRGLQLLEAADVAVYSAKRAGRNRVIVAPELTSVAEACDDLVIERLDRNGSQRGIGGEPHRTSPRERGFVRGRKAEYRASDRGRRIELGLQSPESDRDV